MHGVIFSELRKYVENRLGDSAWPKLLEEAGFAGRMFLPVKAYPDADAVALVSTAVRITGRTADALLEDFGAFIAPDLLKMYGHLLDEGLEDARRHRAYGGDDSQGRSHPESRGRASRAAMRPSLQR